MVLIFFVATFGMNFGVTTALMSKVVYHTGAGKFGIASSVFALGALLGALYAARRKKAGMRLLVVTALVFSLLTVACGFMPTYWLFLIALVPTGMTVISLSTAANASIQLGTPAEMRGRVMGIYMLVFLGGAPLGAPLTGWLAQEVGTRLAMASGGIVSVASAIAVGLVVARHRGVPMRTYLKQTRLQFAR
jgi:MFS family permease